MVEDNRTQATGRNRIGFEPRSGSLKVAGGQSIGTESGGRFFYGPYEYLQHVSLSSLRNALTAACDQLEMDSTNVHNHKVRLEMQLDAGAFGSNGSPYLQQQTRTKVLWTINDPEDFDEDFIFSEPGSLVLTDENELLVEVEFPVEGRDPFEPFPELARVLSSWAQQRRVELVSLEGQQWNTSLWSGYFRLPIRGNVVSDVQSFALDAHEVGAAFVDGALNADLIVAILESGQATAIIGLQESSYFECKSQLRLDEERVRIDFARDVAAFANGNSSGLLVVGLQTKPRRDGDFVAGIHPVSDAARFARLARRTIDRLVFPPIDNLVVKAVAVDAGNNYLVYCLIPEQAPELKPFMVAGAFIDGKIDGALISVPRRRDDETIHLSPASIHAFIAAGYAFFRRSSDRTPPS